MLQVTRSKKALNVEKPCLLLSQLGYTLLLCIIPLPSLEATRVSLLMKIAQNCYFNKISIGKVRDGGLLGSNT
jgi:hypothetical protein